jgi:DNA-binding LacI/PurR family transcriptional regulator
LLEERLTDLPSSLQRDLLEIRRGVEGAGHVCVFVTKTRSELGNEPSRMARLVAQTRAAIWLLVSARLEVVKWFETQSLRVLAWGGRVADSSIPFVALDTCPSIRTIIRELGKLGHRRIVMISPRNWRQPCLGSGFVRVFVEELEALGVRWCDYHLPDWDETPDGLKALLDALFRVTPPQALIVDRQRWAPAVLGFLARRGLRVPKDVSLICLDQDETLAWCDPPIARLRYDETQPIRHILKWILAAAVGKESRKSVVIPAEFDPAGSLGPAVR